MPALWDPNILVVIFSKTFQAKSEAMKIHL